jgi:hypothetical protein
VESDNASSAKPPRRKSKEVELVETALFAVVKFEEAAANYVASAFRVQYASAKYRETLLMYQLASAGRLQAQATLRNAVSGYARVRRQAGAKCQQAVFELTLMANRATRRELDGAERQALAADIARWTELAYAA